MFQTYPPVKVIIPTYNNVDELDATVESLLSQNYSQQKIIISFADFGSNDGTQEKILSYRKEHTGVYILEGKRRGRTMLSDAARTYELQGIGGRDLLLFPGDILYPQFLTTAEDWLYKAHKRGYTRCMLVAEADIRCSDGSLRKVPPLFSKPCLLRPFSLDFGEFIRHGYRHCVFTYGRAYSNFKTKIYTQTNQRVWWNQVAYQDMVEYTVYLDKPLGCLRERWYPDELDELVFRFEQGLTCFRMGKELPEVHVQDDSFEKNYRLQLAKYALWRAWLLYGRGERKIAEDCALFSLVILPPMEDDKIFRSTMKLIADGDEVSASWLKALYEKEDATLAPKWPMGSWLTFVWQNLKMKITGDMQSSRGGGI